ncbi:ubiquinone oxidoreductase 20 kd subunit [Pisolithus sp. B1]|nr:ubiquinone oxidoreductase 20 kd subunit [Pisolithus croceorrhizus]KAI6136632.1 ubiquinone oxidoreductase 20 kd subunit [Pisolithus sp. B1]
MFSRRVVLRALRPCASRRASSTKAPSTAATSLPPATAEDTPRSGIVPQAPNYPTPWSTNQRPRPAARSGPRFEQTAMELQPNPLSALELIANEPVRIVQGRRAVCDGGGGALGHPKIFINLDKPGPHACGYVACSPYHVMYEALTFRLWSSDALLSYCGLRFEQAVHHGYEH